MPYKYAKWSGIMALIGKPRGAGKGPGTKTAKTKTTKTKAAKTKIRIATGSAAAAAPAPAKSSGGRLVMKFFDASGRVSVKRVAKGFGMSKGQLAETIGLKPETVYRAARREAPKTQTRATEMLEIVGRIADWAGGEKQAMAWYRAEPIAAFGGRTAESLVKEGKAAAVRDYLDHVATGGFA
jgi:ribosome-binding protein aMBF1 (putative translation factor)